MSDKTTSIEPVALLDLTTKIVSAYAGKAKLSPAELMETINSVSRALAQIGSANVEPERHDPVPAVAIKKSVTPDYIICLEDGKKLRMLKRHLMSTYGMTPEDYRAKWNLPRDYPMVAPNYARTRSELAKKTGLGKSSRKAAPPPAPPAKPTARRRRPARAGS